MNPSQKAKQKQAMEVNAALKVRNLIPAGRKIPFGWEKGIDGRLSPLASEQATVKRLRGWKGRSRSLRWMASVLNKEGIPTKEDVGGLWFHSTVASVLATDAKYRSAFDSMRVRERFVAYFNNGRLASSRPLTVDDLPRL